MKPINRAKDLSAAIRTENITKPKTHVFNRRTNM